MKTPKEVYEDAYYIRRGRIPEEEHVFEQDQTGRYAFLYAQKIIGGTWDNTAVNKLVLESKYADQYKALPATPFPGFDSLHRELEKRLVNEVALPAATVDRKVTPAIKGLYALLNEVEEKFEMDPSTMTKETMQKAKDPMFVKKLKDFVMERINRLPFLPEEKTQLLRTVDRENNAMWIYMTLYYEIRCSFIQ